MDLQHSTAKAVSVAAFFGLTFGRLDNPSGDVRAAEGGTPPHPRAATAIAAPVAPEEASRDAPDGASDPTCASGMVLVDGEHCPDVEQTCIQWLDPPPYQNLRCAEYARPAKCRTATVHKRFCIDREEYTDDSSKTDGGEPLPVVMKSWLEAKALCDARSARLCKESEWELACEGPDLSPYPYGWKRDSTACNIDRTDLGGPNEKLIDHRAPLTAFPACTSPFGVHNMVGNVDEWVEREQAAPGARSVLRGGWWLPGRNRCRAATYGHGEEYSGKQVGFRCCADTR